MGREHRGDPHRGEGTEEERQKSDGGDLMPSTGRSSGRGNEECSADLEVVENGGALGRFIYGWGRLTKGSGRRDGDERWWSSINVSVSQGGEAKGSQWFPVGRGKGWGSF
jgi:hypothetical protein